MLCNCLLHRIIIMTIHSLSIIKNLKICAKFRIQIIFILYVLLL